MYLVGPTLVGEVVFLLVPSVESGLEKKLDMLSSCPFNIVKTEGHVTSKRSVCSGQRNFVENNLIKSSIHNLLVNILL